MVKINVYTEEAGFFVKHSTVGGVFIKSSGNVLTTLDRVELNNNAPAFYQVCINKPVDIHPNDKGEYPNPEEDCNYYAYLVDENEDYNLAILKVAGIPNLGNATFFNSLPVASQEEMEEATSDASRQPHLMQTRSKP